MPEQDLGAGEMEHPDEVVDVTFPAGDEPPEIVQPGEESLDSPSPSRPPQASTVLGDDATTAPMRGNHLDAVGRHQLFVERVTVVTTIADQARREIGEETGVERGRDEMRLIR